jgi:hypothetical protein
MIGRIKRLIVYEIFFSHLTRLTMVSAAARRLETQEYKEIFYIEDSKLRCRYCTTVVNHEKKSVVDNHLQSKRHIAAKKNYNERRVPLQRTLSFSGPLNDRETINLEIVKAFTAVDIPLEKIDALKPFFLKYCKNGNYLI